jgi:orotate phosphoribosyltransferase/AMMECR1 domain-containing protein
LSSPASGGAGPAHRRELQALLATDGFLDRRDGHVLRNPDGQSMPWMFYGPAVTLSHRGARLAAAVMLDELAGFSGTQLATYGTSAIPLVAACVTQGDGRFSGLVVRKQVKPYGAARKVDGPLDRTRPAVILDESICSGTSVYEATRALEAEGVEVEGAICLVDFAGYGGVPWLEARGYRVRTVYSVWDDLGRSTPPPRFGPGDDVVPWSDATVPSGLDPAGIARFVAAAVCATGRVPRPPDRLDREYECRGGTFVSIRRRSDDVRLAREGFRREGDRPIDAGLDVVLATHLAVRAAQLGGDRDLAGLKFAVSFFGPPEDIPAGRIDADGHGLIVRGRGPLDRLGGALPSTPHYDDEIEQYRYARRFSSFSPYEPHDLQRQSVQRFVEPGASWPLAGASPAQPRWTDDAAFASALGRRLAGLLEELVDHDGDGHAEGDHDGATPAPIEVPEVGEPIIGVGVTLYDSGPIACALGFAPRVDGALAQAAQRVVAAVPAAAGTSGRRGPWTAVVSLLHQPRSLGRMSADRLGQFYRLGRDTLHATAPGRSGLVLAHFAVHQSIGKQTYQDQVLRKAQASGDEAEWTAYETTAWLVAGPAARRLDRGFPAREAIVRPATDRRSRCLALADRLVGFVAAQTLDDGLPSYLYSPWGPTATADGTATRMLLTATGMLRAGRFLGPAAEDRGSRLVATLRRQRDRPSGARDLVWDGASDAQLLVCLSLLADREQHRAEATRLIARLHELVRPDGSIYSRYATGRMAADLDFLSGCVLVALAEAASWQPDALDPLDLDSILAFARRRFDLVHPGGMVWWHGQAWTALADRVPGAGEFAETILAWALERQHETTGAFVIDDLEPNRSSFFSACVLEAVGDAWRGAETRGDAALARRYEQAWLAGMEFVERLVIDADDAYFTRDPQLLVGGVRATLVSSAVRIDYVGHVLLALAKGLHAISASGDQADRCATVEV